MDDVKRQFGITVDADTYRQMPEAFLEAVREKIDAHLAPGAELVVVTVRIYP